MRPVDAVGHVRRVGQRLEAVGAAGRDVERNLVGVPQFEALPVAVRGRAGPQVDDDVEDSAERTANQFRLAVTRADVHTADHPPRRAGDAVLDEGGRVDPRLPGCVRIERAGKEAALVHVRQRLEQQRAADARNRCHAHGTITDFAQ